MRAAKAKRTPQQTAAVAAAWTAVSVLSFFLSLRLFCWFTIPVRSNNDGNNNQNKKSYQVESKRSFPSLNPISPPSPGRFYFFFPLNWEQNETCPLLNSTDVRCLDDIPHRASAVAERRMESETLDLFPWNKKSKTVFDLITQSKKKYGKKGNTSSASSAGCHRES